MVRRAGYLAVIAVSSVALYIFCWIPCRCELNKVRLEHSTLMAAASSPGYVAQIRARTNLESIQEFLKDCPRDLDYLMIAAANQRILGRPDLAIALYREGLETNRRPELYWNLGQSYYEFGHRDLAIQWMSLAASFAPFYLNDMEAQGDLRSILENSVRERHEQIRSGRWRASPLNHRSPEPAQ